jgi:hypothetical protein
LFDVGKSVEARARFRNDFQVENYARFKIMQRREFKMRRKEGGFARFGAKDKAGNPKPLSDIPDVLIGEKGRNKGLFSDPDDYGDEQNLRSELSRHISAATRASNGLNDALKSIGDENYWQIHGRARAGSRHGQGSVTYEFGDLTPLEGESSKEIQAVFGYASLTIAHKNEESQAAGEPKTIRIEDHRQGHETQEFSNTPEGIKQATGFLMYLRDQYIEKKK